MPSDRDIRGFPAGNGLGIPPVGVPTADQEALQEPAFDPVFLLANMGAGAFENIGEGGVHNAIKAATEGLFNKQEMGPFWDEIERRYLARYSLGSVFKDMFKGAGSAIRPTLGAQAASQVMGTPFGYGNVSIGSKPTQFFSQYFK